ncbi:MAG: peptidoglycan-binding protein [Candidatus Pacebacteria bacterium]|nr:peptidoglycan-binding protein [Candidatus Paceibacterota bacterium]
MTITNSSTRLAALVAGVAVALALMGAVAVAPAQAAGLSAAQVQAIVSLLASFGADSATINNVTAALNGEATTGTGTGGTNGGVCPVLTRSLQLGSSGADVMSLQKFLNGTAATRVSVSGAGSPGMETTYFGPATQSAVVKFQAANNVSAIGVVGPATRAAIAAVCGTVVNPGTGTGGSTTLEGGEGQLNDIDNVSADIENEVEEGQEENVYGLEMTAEDSDVMIERVDVQFVLSDADTTQSDNLDDYITEVSLMLDGKSLATLDVDEADELDAGDGDFDSDGDANSTDGFEFRFSGLKGIISEDDTADLYVMVTAVNNVDSTDSTGDWYVNIPTDGIRAVDAAGISDTYVSASESTMESFRVVEADAGDIDLAAASGDNEDRIISVSADTDTDGEEILVFTLESQTSDNNVSQIEIDLATSTATTTQFSSVINQVHLYQGSTKLASADVDDGAGGIGGATVTFEDLDVDIDEDEEVEFRVEADFNDEADEREGFDFIATVDASEIDAEDSEGDDVTVSGDVSGGTIELRTTGISAAFKSATEVRTNGSLAGDADSVDFTLKFSVTAVGDEDIYLDGDVVNAASVSTATAGFAWATTTDSTAFTASSTPTGILTADDGYQSGDDTNNAGDKRFLIESGETRNFTFSVNIPAGTDNQSIGTRITGLKWDTVDQDSMSNLYDFDMSGWTSDTVTGLYIR